ncbi:hypothetical protein Y002_07360 [Staphylococcus aureus MUM270]|nr:hypothetical protein Y002_07360 [Staphylococcus aureus MUM270]
MWKRTTVKIMETVVLLYLFMLGVEPIKKIIHEALTMNDFFIQFI